eukprot:symbB.v1.2.039400.t1/scaffold6538.1/size22092/2
MPAAFRELFESFMNVCISLLILSLFAWQALVVVPPFSVLYWMTMTVYRWPARDLRRLEGTSRSPGMSHFADSIKGARTIRAFGHEAEKCLRQALQKTKLPSWLNLLCCKKRAKGDVAQSTNAALTSDDWLLDTCGPQDSECSADGGKIHSHSRRVFSIVMSEYPEPKKLPNALNDAEEVGKAFSKLDYKVERPAKNVPKDTLEAMFSEFLRSLDTKIYTVVLHIAGHGFEQDGNLVLSLSNGSKDSEDSKVYMDKLLSDLHDRLDKIVLESKSEDDPVHSVGVLVIWDACREALNLTKRSKCRRKLREGERQQAIIHSCMFRGGSEEAVGGSKNSPLILALSDLLGTNSPFNLFELAGHLNARVKAATKFRQSVELRYEGTKLNDCYDWFVDLENCNKLRAHDVVLKRLQAPIHDLKACARLISLWKVPCKSIESVEDVEDCLQSLRDSKQQLLSDSRAPMLDASVQALEQTAEVKRSREEVQEAKGRAAEALQEKDDFLKALEAARRYQREQYLLWSVFNFCFCILPFWLCPSEECRWRSCNCSANRCERCCNLWIVSNWIFAGINSLLFFAAMMDSLLGYDAMNVQDKRLRDDLMRKNV